MIPWNPEAVVLGPGGTRAYYYIGALRALEQAGRLADVRHWVGVSAGALLSVLMAAGYTAEEIYRESLSTDLITFTQPNTLVSLLATWGFLSTTPFEQRLSVLLKAKLGEDVKTFRDFSARAPHSVVVVVSDLDDRRPLYFSVETTPDESIVEAVLASCTVPLLFPARVWRGHRVIDGAFTDPYPLHVAAGKGRTLGLVMLPAAGTRPELYPVAVYDTPVHQLKINAIEQWSDCPTVYHLPILTPILGMELYTDDQKREMVEYGAATAKTHLEDSSPS
jgi:predicted acylesterase/phospholipase RssA